MLQQLSSLKTLKKKVVRKALDMIKRIMDDDPDEIISEDEGLVSTLSSCRLIKLSSANTARRVKISIVKEN